MGTGIGGHIVSWGKIKTQKHPQGTAVKATPPPSPTSAQHHGSTGRDGHWLGETALKTWSKFWGMFSPLLTGENGGEGGTGGAGSTTKDWCSEQTRWGGTLGRYRPAKGLGLKCR